MDYFAWTLNVALYVLLGTLYVTFGLGALSS